MAFTVKSGPAFPPPQIERVLQDSENKRIGVKLEGVSGMFWADADPTEEVIDMSEMDRSKFPYWELITRPLHARFGNGLVVPLEMVGSIKADWVGDPAKHSFGLCVAVDDNGIPYLTNEKGEALDGVVSFSVHVAANDIVRIVIGELEASKPNTHKGDEHDT